MRNSFLVVRYEIITMLSKPSFWLMAFLFPLFILAISVGPQLLAGDLGPNTIDLFGTEGVGEMPVIGYVDEANLIQNQPAAFPPDMFRAFAGETTAQAALNAGEITEYYLISPDYVASGQLVVVKEDVQPFGSDNDRLMEYLLAYNLTGDEVLAAVLLQPTAAINSQSLAEVETEAAAAPQDDLMTYVVPFAAMFVFFFLITMSSSYMLQSVSREKENRVVEVLLVSLEPRQLMLGKLIGLSLLALLQMVIWAGAGLLIAGRGSELTAVTANLPTGFIVWGLFYFLAGYFMYASLMGAVGALAPSAREGGQFVFFVLLPLLIPVWLNFVLINSPNSALAVGLSLFPLTAPVAMITRMVATEVALWQLLASLLAQLGTAYLFVLLAARFFRADTLLADTALSWRRLWQATAVQK
jgi:ABC-2 type transport system permease protein